MAFGQNYWGAKLGINAGTLTGDDADANDWGAESKGSRAGFVGGAFLDFRLNDMFGVRPELLSSGKGAKYEGDGWDLKFIYRTLEVPILLQFFLPIPTDVLDIAVFAGPAPALIYSTKYEYSETGYDEEGDMEDAGFEMATFDLGVAFGLGFGIPAGPGEVLVDFRYTIGLFSSVEEIEVDLNDDGIVDARIDDPILRTGTFGATVGYGFEF